MIASADVREGSMNIFIPHFQTIFLELLVVLCLEKVFCKPEDIPHRSLGHIVECLIISMFMSAICISLEKYVSTINAEI